MKPEELERHFAPGQPILDRGTQDRDLFIIRSGNVFVDWEDGSEVRMLGPGAVFGEINAVVGQPSPYRAEADEEVTVLVLDPPLVNQLCSENAEFGARLVRHLAEELAAATQDRGALGGIDQRLAQGFRQLIPVVFDLAKGTETPIPVEGKLVDVAKAAGMSPLDAYFCIQRLLEARVVRLVDDQLAIVDPGHLEQLRH